jgi:hypothetical protein
MMVELSYAESYTHDDGGDQLNQDTRVHLALVANEFEFLACIDECVLSFARGVDFGRADPLPE